VSNQQLPNALMSAMESENFDGTLRINSEVFGKYAMLKVANSYVSSETWKAKTVEDLEWSDVLVKFQLWGVMTEKGKMLAFNSEREGDQFWNLYSDVYPVSELGVFFEEDDLKSLFEKGVKAVTLRNKMKESGEYTDEEIFEAIRPYQSSVFVTDVNGLVLQFAPRTDEFKAKDGELKTRVVMSNFAMGPATIGKKTVQELDPDKGVDILPEDLDPDEETEAPSTPSSGNGKSVQRKKKKKQKNTVNTEEVNTDEVPE